MITRNARADSLLVFHAASREIVDAVFVQVLPMGPFRIIGEGGFRGSGGVLIFSTTPYDAIHQTEANLVT